MDSEKWIIITKNDKQIHKLKNQNPSASKNSDL